MQTQLNELKLALQQQVQQLDQQTQALKQDINKKYAQLCVYQDVHITMNHTMQLLQHTNYQQEAKQAQLACEPLMTLIQDYVTMANAQIEQMHKDELLLIEKIAHLKAIEGFLNEQISSLYMMEQKQQQNALDSMDSGISPLLILTNALQATTNTNQQQQQPDDENAPSSDNMTKYVISKYKLAAQRCKQEYAQLETNRIEQLFAHQWKQIEQEWAMEAALNTCAQWLWCLDAWQLYEQEYALEPLPMQQLQLQVADLVYQEQRILASLHKQQQQVSIHVQRSWHEPYLMDMIKRAKSTSGKPLVDLLTTSNNTETSSTTTSIDHVIRDVLMQRVQHATKQASATLPAVQSLIDRAALIQETFVTGTFLKTEEARIELQMNRVSQYEAEQASLQQAVQNIQAKNKEFAISVHGLNQLSEAPAAYKSGVQSNTSFSPKQLLLAQ